MVYWQLQRRASDSLPLPLRRNSEGRGEVMLKIEFELTQEQADEIKALMDLTGTQTHRELINNALSLLEWAAQQRQESGRHIYARADCIYDAGEEFSSPIINNMAAKKWI
jgi:hypothetical protein